MNSFTLVCKLKTIPALSYTQEATPRSISTFGVDVSDPNPEKKEAFPLRVTLFGKGAEAVVNMGLAIGEPLLVEGRLKMDLVERPEGFKEKRGEVICNRLQRLKLDSAPPAQQQPVQQVPVTPVTHVVAPPPPVAAPPVVQQQSVAAPPPATDSFSDIPF
jgi:single-strand DNA-binding protein